METKVNPGQRTAIYPEAIGILLEISSVSRRLACNLAQLAENEEKEGEKCDEQNVRTGCCRCRATQMRRVPYAYVTALAVPLIYYGISVLLGNVTFTGSPFSAMIAYFPWTLLQGGLEEVGWRWYLQTHISIKKSFVLKMLVISVIWFIWHFPIYRLPWITAGSSNYLIFFLMILGNTFTLGAVKELSRGSIPCILAHMLIDTAAVTMLVGSNLTKVALLVGVEIILSVILVGILGRRQKQQSQV